ncbi:MAG: STAS domain-containing protein [Candidatus Brocadiia bacterium]
MKDKGRGMKTARHQPPPLRPSSAGVHPSARRAQKPSADEGSVVSLEVERRGAVCLVSPHGRIGEAEAHPFQRELLALADQGATQFIVDLSDVSFMTSSCLGALMVVYKRVRPQGGYVRLASAQPLVQRVLEITKLTRLFGRHRTVREALAAK